MRFADVSAFISADVHDRGYYPREEWRLYLSPSRCARMSLGGFEHFWAVRRIKILAA